MVLVFSSTNIKNEDQKIHAPLNNEIESVELIKKYYDDDSIEYAYIKLRGSNGSFEPKSIVGELPYKDLYEELKIKNVFRQGLKAVSFQKNFRSSEELQDQFRSTHPS